MSLVPVESTTTGITEKRGRGRRMSWEELLVTGWEKGRRGRVGGREGGGRERGWKQRGNGGRGAGKVPLRVGGASLNLLLTA